MGTTLRTLAAAGFTVAAVAALGPNAAAAPTPLQLRSAALNCLYGSDRPATSCYPALRRGGESKLHCYRIEIARNDRPAWERALEVRSKALNCLYDLV